MARFQSSIQRVFASRAAERLLAVDGFIAEFSAGGRVRVAGYAVVLSLFLLSTSSMLFRLGDPEVCDFNEAVEGVALQQMVEHGNLLFPRLSGGEPTYKPPLFHWTGTALAALLGMHRVTELTLRLPSVVYALAGVLLTIAFARRRFGLHSALLSGLILLASYQYVEQSRVGRVDMTLAFFETLAVFAFLWWLPHRESGGPVEHQTAPCGAHRLIWHYALALAMGCAVLAKGPVGALLPLLAIAAFLASEKRWEDFRTLCKPGPTVLFLAVGGSWYLACCVGDGGAFLARQLGSENLGRYSGSLGTMPPWYYVKPLLLNSAPLSLLVPAAVYTALRRRSRITEAPGIAASDPAAKLLALFWLLTVVFFSTAAYKRRAYLLPLWPAAAVLLGWWLHVIAGDRRGKIIRGAITVLCVVLPIVNLVYIPRHKAAACAESPYRDAAAAIKRIVGGDDELYVYGAPPPMPLVFYLGRTIEPMQGSVNGMPPGYALVPASLWAHENRHGSAVDTVLTRMVGGRKMALLHRRTIPAR